MGGVVFRGKRALKSRERRYLRRHCFILLGCQLAMLGSYAVFLAWAIASEDIGLRYLSAILLLPLLIIGRHLQRYLRPIYRDLRDNRVESLIGRVGSLVLTTELIPLDLGERTYYVPSRLFDAKKLDQPILIEYLPACGHIISIDGKANFPSLPLWLKLQLTVQRGP
ncbi:MAG: hypothetical protein HY692_07695 [Cyanobacteria bacterium NC_groundwater_1444_Ag_S-0.65um_54_12]|nr:hypothetical protein [Cyanobacteria bacterium NC_groundwater_1444_Ag_S-0.65um_54_12]